MICELVEARNLQKKRHGKSLETVLKSISIIPQSIQSWSTTTLPGSVSLSNLAQSSSEIYQPMNKSLDTASQRSCQSSSMYTTLHLRTGGHTGPKHRAGSPCAVDTLPRRSVQLFHDSLPEIKDGVAAVKPEESKGIPHYSLNTTKAVKILRTEISSFPRDVS